MNDKTTLGDPLRDFSSLVRPHYSAGLLLQDDDLTQGVTYTRALSRMMFRTLFGCGVLCGLEVSAPETDKCGVLTIGVAKGLALDCIGDPVEVPMAKTLKLTCATDVGNELWIALRKLEKCCAPRTAVCSPDENDPPSVCTRERDGFELQVFSARPCSCGCAQLAPKTAPVPVPTLKKATGKTAKEKSAAAETAAATKAGHSTADALEQLPADNEADCLCNHRNQPGACYEKHYGGECPCDCCDCEWILLAMAERKGEGQWTVDHSVRRFVRPVLMRDPIVERERSTPGS